MKNKQIYVELEGAKIERNFLIDNIKEARSVVSFKKVKFSDLFPQKSSHAHCIICLKAIARNDFAFTSHQIFVCNFCHERFIEKEDFLKSISELPTVED